MKALCTLAFALTLDSEDDLVELARAIDENFYAAIRDHFTRERADLVMLKEAEDMFDWYGAVISVRRPVFGVLEEEEGR